MPLRILCRQTTYWDLHDGERSFRIHFLGKEEQAFSQAEISSFEIVREHPVLLEYQHRWESLYVSSVPRDPESLLRRLRHLLDRELAPWRDPDRYFNLMAGPLSVLGHGYGLLFKGPEPLAAKLSGWLEGGEVESRRLPDREVREPMQAFIAGMNYVVAQEFRVERV